MASGSVRYMMRHVLSASTIRNSWQRAPTDGIGRECGRLNSSPRCKGRSRNPASRRASVENGGVFTSPRSHTSDLSVGDMAQHIMSYMTYKQEVVTTRKRAMTQALTTTSSSKPVRHAGEWANNHAVAVYLARLAPGSRRTMRTALETIAELLSGKPHQAFVGYFPTRVTFVS